MENDVVDAQPELLELLAARRGHFLLESGHHGDLWFDLELLCSQPRRVQPLCAELASRLSQFKVDVVCGPLIEGALVGLMVASELNVRFAYSERFMRPGHAGLFPAGYRIPASLRPTLKGKRVAIVNDVINAGSAVIGTYANLQACGANVVTIGALLVLGSAASEFARAKGVELESLAHLPNQLWEAAKCPLCSSGLSLEDEAGFATRTPADLPGHSDPSD
jgi:orotate phosphoribosyltransferase